MARPPRPGKGPKLLPPDNKSYEVGYGKPPAETRFKPGKSGNPRGRPKGARTKVPTLDNERLKSLILEEAYRAIRINEGDKQVTVPMAQAIIRAIAVNAVKGQTRAQRLFTEMLAATERENRMFNEQWLDVAITYKIEWDRELQRRRELGITHLPEPLPHPDHIAVDLRAGTARIVGPCTPEEKMAWDRIRARRAELEEELEELEQMLEDPACAHREVILDDMEHTRRILGILINMERRWS